jgi:hypothetical protein
VVEREPTCQRHMVSMEFSPHTGAIVILVGLSADAKPRFLPIETAAEPIKGIRLFSGSEGPKRATLETPRSQDCRAWTLSVSEGDANPPEWEPSHLGSVPSGSPCPAGHFPTW